MLQGAPPLHLHHAPLDASVIDVAEVLSVPLHTLCHQIRGGGSEAALVLLKVLMISHLESRCDNRGVNTELTKNTSESLKNGVCHFLIHRSSR